MIKVQIVITCDACHKAKIIRNKSTPFTNTTLRNLLDENRWYLHINKGDQTIRKHWCTECGILKGVLTDDGFEMDWTTEG